MVKIPKLVRIFPYQDFSLFGLNEFLSFFLSFHTFDEYILEKLANSQICM